MTRTLFRLLAFAAAPRSRLALSLVLGSMTLVFGVGLMGTSAYLISRAAEHPPIFALAVAIVGVRFFGLGRPIVRYLGRLTGHDLAFRVLGRVRARFYERVEPLAPTQIAAYRHGDLLSRMVADVDSLQDLYLRGIDPLVAALIAGTVSIVVAALLLPAAAIVLAVGLLVAGAVVPSIVAMISHRVARTEAPTRGELSAELLETLGASAELAVYGKEEERISQLRSADHRLVRAANRASLADGLGDGLRTIVTGATVAGVIAVAVSAHASGKLDSVLIAVLALLALASFEAVQPLAQAARTLASTSTAGTRILELSDREPLIVDPVDPAQLPEGPISISVEHVSASYDSEDPLVIDDVSLRLDRGARVALIGPSGAGKTTIVNLLLRFLDPVEGRVTIAGRDIRDYKPADVREAIAVAGQDAHLFSTSIRENVRIGRFDARDKDVESALRLAGIWDWVCSLPEGWNTLVGEQGRELSGGQRQRVAVARALLANASVLVLDEPTAHLDHETAEGLVRDVFAAAGERSVLLITHRPEGLDLVDEIVSLEPGRT